MRRSQHHVSYYKVLWKKFGIKLLYNTGIGGKERSDRIGNFLVFVNKYRPEKAVPFHIRKYFLNDIHIFPNVK